MNFLLASYFASPAGANGGKGFGWPPRSSGLTSPFGCMRGAGFQTPAKSCGSKAFDLVSAFIVPDGCAVWENAPVLHRSSAANAPIEPTTRFRMSKLLSRVKFSVRKSNPARFQFRDIYSTG